MQVKHPYFGLEGTLKPYECEKDTPEDIKEHFLKVWPGGTGTVISVGENCQVVLLQADGTHIKGAITDLTLHNPELALGKIKE